MTTRPARAVAAIAAVVGLLAAALPPAGSPVLAQAKAKQKDPGERPEHYPAGPHREDTFYFCTACHSFRIVAAQGLSRERWDESLTWMTERHKMPELAGKEREQVLEYLSAAFPERRTPGGWKNPFAPN